MNYHVAFSPEALNQLVELFHYITETASPDIATQYTDALVPCAFP